MAFCHFASGFSPTCLQMEDISLALYELMADSALESIFSVLKHTSGGNLSPISYSPALGRLISRKALIQNKNSEKGYRDVKLNIDGGQPLLKTRFPFCALVFQIRFVNTSSHPLLLNRHLEEDKAAMPVQ